MAHEEKEVQYEPPTEAGNCTCSQWKYREILSSEPKFDSCWTCNPHYTRAIEQVMVTGI